MCCGMGQTTTTVSPDFWDCLVIKLQDWMGVPPLAENASAEEIQRRQRQDHEFKRALQLGVLVLVTAILLPRLISR
jgi:hypothetical protein